MNEKVRILVVDDDESGRYALGRCLRSANYDVIEAASGGDCLEHLTRYDVDLVLLDVKLPDVNGMEVCRQIKSDPRTTSVPVIQVSAQFTGRDDRIRGLESGADIYLTTPFDPRELLAHVGALVRLRRSEAALEASEKRYRQLFSSMHEAFFVAEVVTDLKGLPVDYRFLDVNPALERLVGLGRSQLVGKLVTEALPGVDQHWVDFFGKVALTGDPAQFEQYSTPLGRWYEANAYSPHPRQFAATFRDTTNRRQLEARLRTFFRSEMMGAIYWNTDGRITDANDKFLRMVGYTREEVLGGKVSWQQMTPPEYRPQDEHALDELKNRGVDTPYEKEFIRKDGTRVPIFIGAAMLDNDEHEGVGFVLDISDRKQAENALRQSEQRLRLAQAAAGLGIFDCNLVTHDLHVDGRVRELCGLAPDEQVDKERFLPEIHPDDRPAVQAALDRALNPAGDGHSWLECRLVRRGKMRWLGITARATFEAGKAVRLIGTVQDITERKDFQAELERLVEERTARLNELVGELEHFSYTLTHDMRAPLRSLRGSAELLRELCGSRLNAEETAHVSRVITSGERMDLLITDALSYTQAVRHHLALGPVDLTALVRGMLDTYPEYQAAKADIVLRGDIPLVLGNQAGLTQVFSNLLHNAIKFAKPGQHPEVRIWAETVTIPAAEDRRGPAGESRIRIWIEDNGIGISQTMLPRIFNLFGRGRSSKAGTGIGLALVRKLMDRMGGRAGVISTEGQGSRFWIELLPGDAPLPVSIGLPSTPARPGSIL